MRLSHKRNAIADRERHFVLAISDMHAKVGAGIVIRFEEAVTSLIFEFHTNANLPFGLVGFQFRHQFGIENHRAESCLVRSAEIARSSSRNRSIFV